MPNNVIKCPRCENIIGRLVTIDEINEIEVLDVGGGFTRFFHGTCNQCGEEIHWSIAETALANLLKKYCNREESVL